jgi:two-component system sensor histidine kinase/response regulator
MQQKKKILVVDDNPTNNEIVQEILKDDYDLKIATTGEEALKVASDFRPDLVLLDIKLPGMNGYDVCRQLRASSNLMYTKIIMVSAKKMTSERLDGYKAGSDDYITKPFDEDEFRAKINVYLRLKHIEEIDQLRQDFITKVTHEMRTPMNVVKCFISNALEEIYGKIKPELRQQLEIANCNIDRLGRIITNFFEMSRIEAGKVGLRITRFDIQDMVLEVVDELRPKADSRQIKILTEPPSEKLHVIADREKLAVTLTHLIENAIKFIQEGGSINVRVNSRNGKTGIDVEDDGPGIPKNDTERIFERFVQVEKQVGPGEHGTGLGLAVAKGLINLHGGRIWVQNKPNGGSVFSFEIPDSQKTEKTEEPVLCAAENGSVTD